MYLIECSIGYKMKIQYSIRILVIQYVSWKLFLNLLIYIHLVLTLNDKYKFHNIHLLTHCIIVIKYVIVKELLTESGMNYHSICHSQYSPPMSLYKSILLLIFWCCSCKSYVIFNAPFSEGI